MNADKKRKGFATAINCMDGRTQVPVIEHLRATCGVEYVDAVTEPGPVRILADPTHADGRERIFRRVDVSVHEHGSRCVAVVAHADCAGNPADKDTQLRQLAAARETVRARYPDVEIRCLWLGTDWAVVPVE